MEPGASEQQFSFWKNRLLIRISRGFAFALEILLFIELSPQMPNPPQCTKTIPENKEGRAFAAEISCLMRSPSRKCATPATKFIHRIPLGLPHLEVVAGAPHPYKLPKP
jgi:hypothetical protein